VTGESVDWQDPRALEKLAERQRVLAEEAERRRSEGAQDEPDPTGV
jgi:hypothetical protein